MSKYIVRFVADRYISAEIEVEANSKKQAEDKAWEEHLELFWDSDGGIVNPEISETTKI